MDKLNINIENKSVEELVTNINIFNDRKILPEISMKIGKFVRILLPELKSKDIEDFVNKFKSILKYDENDFEIVYGEDIRKWYDEENYNKGKYSLNKSCMRYKKCSKYFDIYVKNPQVVSMLILKDKDTELINGRALIWKLSDMDYPYFMDRIYTTSQYLENKFLKYATNRNWLTKTQQDISSDIFDKKNKKKLTIVIPLNENLEYEYFPYMDTLKFFKYNEYYLTNEYDNTNDVYILQETDGSYSSDDDMVYDIYAQEMIDVNDAIYCDYEDGYCHMDDAIYLEYKGVYVTPTYDYVVFSDYDNCYYLKDDCVSVDGYDYVYIEDCVYSNYYGRYILCDLAKKALDNNFNFDNVYETDIEYSKHYKENIIRDLFILTLLENDEDDYYIEEDTIYSKYYKRRIVTKDCVSIKNSNGELDFVYEKDEEDATL